MPFDNIVPRHVEVHSSLRVWTLASIDNAIELQSQYFKDAGEEVAKFQLILACLRPAPALIKLTRPAAALPQRTCLLLVEFL